MKRTLKLPNVREKRKLERLIKQAKTRSQSVLKHSCRTLRTSSLNSSQSRMNRDLKRKQKRNLRRERLKPTKSEVRNFRGGSAGRL